MSRTPPGTRADYAAFTPITTRWADNDAYGHINNVQYYSFFDTAVNAWLVRQGLLDITASAEIGLVVETGCRYHRPIAYPDPIEVGMRLASLGNSSIRYELAVFAPGNDTAAAEGHFVHVYVDRATGRPSRLPDALRAAAESLRAPGSGSA
ncbi:acyl-CoA thioesterase [Rhodovarius crocodyli]|uniref:Acyl-CoA thioesterase n=1 Tax=Rhodovarius crocodyli TaxID=1979269 RepID=A0A437MGY8_9PROT|nr:thioesterase family protein [Rhodovarius crocodyli]RVT96855.1 acyl-CoA thioesterase [Rhodovarius crocodyli]